MTHVRFAQFPEKVIQIITFAQNSYQALNEVNIVPESSLPTYQHDKWDQQFRENPRLYEQHASNTLDYIILQVPDILDPIIQSNYPRTFGLMLTTAAIKARLDPHINPAARYFDHNCSFVPMITSEKLYKKMQWVEWVLTELQGVEVPTLVKSLLSVFINKRLPATINRLNEYAAKNGLTRIPVSELKAAWISEMQSKAAKGREGGAENESDEDEYYDAASTTSDGAEDKYEDALDERDHILLLAKHNIIAVIEEHQRRVRDPKIKLHITEPLRRSNELRDEINASQCLSDLEKVLCRFILTGQTKSDGAFDRSYTADKNCLRRMICDVFLPHFLKTTTSFLSPRLFSNTYEIKGHLNLFPDMSILSNVMKKEARRL